MNEHVPVSDGSPYDHSKVLTCQHCIDIIHAQRASLCEKYGWSEWPDVLKGAY